VPGTNTKMQRCRYYYLNMKRRNGLEKGHCLRKLGNGRAGQPKCGILSQSMIFVWSKLHEPGGGGGFTTNIRGSTRKANLNWKVIIVER